MNALGADLIPDPTTAGDFCRRFSEADVITLMESINAVRPRLWRGRGRDFLGPIAYIDVDGTLAPTYGERKAGMDISYKGVWGYHPLIVSLANTKEVLYLVNRTGNVPSHTDAARWIDAAIDQVAPYAPRLCLRGDTDFSLTQNFDRWAERVDFIFGTDNNQALRKRARGAARGSLARAGALAAVRAAHGSDARAASAVREGAHRHRARLPQLPAQLRGGGGIRVPARPLPPTLSRRGRAQEHQPHEG